MLSLSMSNIILALLSAPWIASAQSTTCPTWCNAWTCDHTDCAGCATTKPTMCPTTCASWCNSHTCDKAKCSGCSICDETQRGVHCAAWCNKWLCPIFAQGAVGSSSMGTFFSQQCDGCADLCSFHKNTCPYTNSLFPGGNVLAVVSGNRVTSCDQIIDSKIPAGTSTTLSSGGSSGTTARPELKYYCQATDGALAGIFLGTAGFMPYAHVCPETCTRVPACATAVDNNAFMIQAYGNPAGCAPFVNFGYCLKNCLRTDGVEYCVTNGAEAVIQAACPASCAAATPPANAAVFGTPGRRMEGEAMASLRKNLTLSVAGSFALSASTAA